jgi:hypothetical protein
MNERDALQNIAGAFTAGISAKCRTPPGYFPNSVRIQVLPKTYSFGQNLEFVIYF